MIPVVAGSNMVLWYDGAIRVTYHENRVQRSRQSTWTSYKYDSIHCFINDHKKLVLDVQPDHILPRFVLIGENKW